VGPLTIADRQRLFDGMGKLDDYMAVFPLTKERPLIAEPIEIGSKLYLVYLLDRSEKSALAKDPVSPEEESKGAFLSQWLEKSIAKAKVQDYRETK